MSDRKEEEAASKQKETCLNNVNWREGKVQWEEELVGETGGAHMLC